MGTILAPPEVLEPKLGHVLGRPLPRNEDFRLITGTGLYVDDLRLDRMAYGALVRSPYAHARIRAIDTRDALQSSGVLAVFTARDLGPLAGPLPLLIPHPALTHGRTHVALASQKARHAGEPVAFVVAEDRYTAADAAERVAVDYEPLEPVVDLARAAQPDSPRVHDDVPGNIAAHYRHEIGDFRQAAAEAGKVFELDLRPERGIAASIENRGIVAQFDHRSASLTIWCSTQAPIPLRNGLANLLGLPEHRVRVVAPDVGGGFGPKIMIYYPEEILVPYAAMRLGRPVKWSETRSEYFLCASHEREQRHRVEVAVRANGQLLGVKDVFLHDTGAYTPYGLITPVVTSCTLPGPYRIRNYHIEFRAVYTNKTMVTPVRGAGRSHAVFVMERIMDLLATELKLDRAEVRRRNLIQPNEMPYDVGITYQDGAPTRYDSGDYPGLFAELLRRANYASWATTKAAYRRHGRYVGLGLGFYVEGAGVGPYEGASVRVELSGKIFVSTGVGSQGQGHLTSLAQIVAAQLGVDVRNVEVVTGDTGQFPWGIGTFASRTAVVDGNAVLLAAQAVRQKAVEAASRYFRVPPNQIVFGQGRVHVRREPGRGITLGELARVANPLRGTIPPDTHPGLEATRFFNPPQATFPYGGHAAIVEVDPESGAVSLLHYLVVHDCGPLLNPLIVEGQIHGGVAHGLGSALYERLVYDRDGRLLSSTFMDYHVPTATTVPAIETHHLETPSPLNPLGVKGVGEAGVIPVPAVIAQAVEDALGVHGLTQAPVLPEHIRALWRRTSGSATPPP